MELDEKKLGIFDRIKNLLKKDYLVEEKEISLELGINNLGLDSLDFAELLMSLEENFLISISEIEFQEVKTIEDLILLIDKKIP